MKLGDNLHILFFASFGLMEVISCQTKEPFSTQDLRFVRPYQKPKEIIYKSATNQTDTIRFEALLNDTFSPRNFEQGFYDEVSLKVNYSLSPGSFHQILRGPGNKEPESFILFLSANGSFGSKEICFLGLLFNEKFLNRPIQDTAGEISFEKRDARYYGVNINQGITSFKFSFDEGVVSFTDSSNIIWNKVN